MRWKVALRGGLLAGVGLSVLALSGCTAPHTIRLDRIDYASQDYENGPTSNFTVYWSGNPKLPISLEYTPAPGCSHANQTCAAGTYLFPRQTNPLVWSAGTDCVGNLGPDTPPWTGGSYYTLVDAAGDRSSRVLLVNTCYYHPVATILRSAVFHDQPWLTQVLRPVTEISWKAVDLSKSLVISLGLIFLIAFPSQLFNSTMQSHYDEVMGWLTWARPLQRLAGWLRRRTQTTEEGSPGWLLAGVFLLGGLLGSLLDPDWGFDVATLEGLLGMLLATAFTTTVYTWAHRQYLSRAVHLTGHFRAYGGGVIVALGCLLISRATSAQPGYLYGVLLGYTLGAAAPKLARHHEGRNVAIGAGAALVVSVAVWLLWTPVKAAADATDAFPLVVLSTAMAGVFAGGITSLLFGLLPLRWLDGEKLLAWQRFVWLLLVLVAMFLFIHVVMNNAASTEHAGRNLVVTVALFIAFGALSTGFWAYFRFRPEPLAVGSATATP